MNLMPCLNIIIYIVKKSLLLSSREREGESEVWFIMVASDSEGRFLPATRSDLSNRLENSRRTKWISNA